MIWAIFIPIIVVLFLLFGGLAYYRSQHSVVKLPQNDKEIISRVNYMQKEINKYPKDDQYPIFNSISSMCRYVQNGVYRIDQKNIDTINKSLDNEGFLRMNSATFINFLVDSYISTNNDEYLLIIGCLVAYTSNSYRAMNNGILRLLSSSIQYGDNMFDHIHAAVNAKDKREHLLAGKKVDQLTPRQKQSYDKLTDIMNKYLVPFPPTSDLDDPDKRWGIINQKLATNVVEVGLDRPQRIICNLTRYKGEEVNNPFKYVSLGTRDDGIARIEVLNKLKPPTKGQSPTKIREKFMNLTYGDCIKYILKAFDMYNTFAIINKLPQGVTCLNRFDGVGPNIKWGNDNPAREFTSTYGRYSKESLLYYLTTTNRLLSLRH